MILTDPIDEMWVDAVPAFGGKQFHSVAKGQVDLETDEEKAEAQERAKDFASMLEWMTSSLEADVKEVRLSSRLTTSPACLVGDENDLTPTMEKMYRAMGQQLPPIKRILELNPTHSLVTALHKAFADKPTDAGLAETAELLYGLALLAEGGELTDPSRFVKLVSQRAEQTLA